MEGAGAPSKPPLGARGVTSRTPPNLPSAREVSQAGPLQTSPSVGGVSQAGPLQTSPSVGGVCRRYVLANGYAGSARSILAQESRRDTVRLKTRASGFESTGSAQK